MNTRVTSHPHASYRTAVKVPGRAQRRPSVGGVRAGEEDDDDSDMGADGISHGGGGSQEDGSGKHEERKASRQFNGIGHDFTPGIGSATRVDPMLRNGGSTALNPKIERQHAPSNLEALIAKHVGERGLVGLSSSDKVYTPEDMSKMTERQSDSQAVEMKLLGFIKNHCFLAVKEQWSHVPVISSSPILGINGTWSL